MATAIKRAKATATAKTTNPHTLDQNDPVCLAAELDDAMGGIEDAFAEVIELVKRGKPIHESTGALEEAALGLFSVRGRLKRVRPDDLVEEIEHQDAQGGYAGERSRLPASQHGAGAAV